MDEPVIQYTGDRGVEEHHEGIPARDLTEADLKALTTEQRAVVRGSAIYDYAGYAEARKAEKADPAPAPVAAHPAPQSAAPRRPHRARSRA